MVEQPNAGPQMAADLRSRLQELGQLLSESDQLEPESQHELAGLVTELGEALDAGKLDPSTIQALADSTREMTLALRHQHKSLLTSARDGLERVVVQAEDSHPIVTRFAERLIDVLSNIGI